jgi:hypothetical protein
MRKIMMIAAVALPAAGCGNSAPSPQATVTVTATAAASGAATASPSRQTAALARANARLLVDALANGSSGSIASARKSVAGPVMTRYIGFQVVDAQAWEESGQPSTSASVTATGGGSYQICWPQGQGCQSFSAFQSDAAGRITGMDVGSQPVATRLAAGHPDRGNGLMLTDVASYRFTFPAGQVGISFRVRNTGNLGVSTNGFQVVFVTSRGGTRLSPDLGASSMNSTQPLRPGESASFSVAFDTRIFTGTFIVQSNGGYQELVGSRLRKVAT